MTDMVFSAPIHQDPLQTVDIIDQQWATDTLPIEDIQIPSNALSNIDDDDPTLNNEHDDDNKWNHLALDDIPR